jgi:hypothetical protein
MLALMKVILLALCVTRIIAVKNNYEITMLSSNDFPQIQAHNAIDRLYYILTTIALTGELLAMYTLSTRKKKRI